MTTFRKYIIATLAIVAVLFTSCVDDDDNMNFIDGNNSAFDYTSMDPDFSIFNTALIRSGLDVTLDNQGSFTLFAPNNAAFSQYLTVNGFASIEDIPVSDLRKIVSYHILNTIVTSELITTGYINTLAKDEEVESLDLFIEATTPVLLNGTVEITMDDIEVDNGIIHVIDNVLDLPTITTLIAANPDFTNLETALTQTGLEITLSNTDTTMQDPFTVFAPTDTGFQALVDISTTDAINSLLDVYNLTNLSDILLYHVVGNDRLRSGDISNGLVVNPIATGDFTIDTTSGTVITDATSTTATITSTDVTAINGVIHTIDIVLRPM